jgi:hypothetical protein
MPVSARFLDRFLTRGNQTERPLLVVSCLSESLMFGWLNDCCDYAAVQFQVFVSCTGLTRGHDTIAYNPPFSGDIKFRLVRECLACGVH